MAGLRIGAYLSFLLLLAGCGSNANGVTEAMLEKSKAEDTRACYIAILSLVDGDALAYPHPCEKVAARHYSGRSTGVRSLPYTFSIK